MRPLVSVVSPEVDCIALCRHAIGDHRLEEFLLSPFETHPRSALDGEELGEVSFDLPEHGDSSCRPRLVCHARWCGAEEYAERMAAPQRAIGEIASADDLLRLFLREVQQGRAIQLASPGVHLQLNGQRSPYLLSDTCVVQDRLRHYCASRYPDSESHCSAHPPFLEYANLASVIDSCARLTPST